MRVRNIALLVLLVTPLLFAKTGEELFNDNCAVCHATILGVTNDGGYENSYITPAPYVTDLVQKLKDKSTTKERFAEFIRDYIENPDKRKTLYGKKAIKKFGLMPPLKGVMSDEELSKLVNYLV